MCFTCEVPKTRGIFSHVKPMWKGRVSHVKFHMWFFTCVSDVKFYMWNFIWEISFVKITCDISHVKVLYDLFVQFYMLVHLMWKLASEITCGFSEVEFLRVGEVTCEISYYFTFHISNSYGILFVRLFSRGISHVIFLFCSYTCCYSHINFKCDIHKWCKKITCEKSHVNFYTCEIHRWLTCHMWNFTCEISHVNFPCEISRVKNMSHVNFTCEISHVKFLIWKAYHMWISHVKFHMWNFTCEISHVKSMSHGKHMGYGIHMCFWNFTCESHVKHMTIFCKGVSE